MSEKTFYYLKDKLEVLYVCKYENDKHNTLKFSQNKNVIGKSLVPPDSKALENDIAEDLPWSEKAHHFSACSCL